MYAPKLIKTIIDELLRDIGTDKLLGILYEYRRKLYMIKLMYAENRAQLSAAAIAYLFSIIPDQERQKIESLYRLKDKQASLLGKLLLFQSLNEFEGVEKNLSAFTYSANGKPLLNGAGVSFNISHSGDYVVCAVANEQQIGIDIEKIVEIDPDKLSCALSPSELAYVKKSQRKNFEFFKIWTAKEAILKAKGLGIQRDMTGFEILHKGVWLYRQELFFLTEIEIDPTYCCIMATTTRPYEIQKDKLIPEFIDEGLMC